MNHRAKRRLPSKLVEAQQEFEQWRSQQSPGAHLPKHLWSMAVELAREFGVSQTASTLKLNYSGLKKRLEPPAAQHPSAPQPNNPFLELLPLPTPGPRECTIECKDTSGTQLRIQLKGITVSELTALCGALWGLQR